MQQPTLRHRAEYALFRTVVAVVHRLPHRTADRVGALLGLFAGVVLRVRRREVDERIGKAFPDASRAWHRKVARGSYAHIGREGVAVLRLARAGPAEIRARTDIEGLEELQEALRDGRGGVLVTGHLGNWEIGGAALAANGVPMSVVATRQRNRLFDRDLVETRRRLGMEVIFKGEATKGVLRALGAGRACAIVGDQDARSAGVFVDFFGIPASTARGAALFALRSRAPLFAVAVRREPGRLPRYRLVIEPIPVERTGDLDADVHRVTEEHVRRLERSIRESPEQYFWLHRRWRSRPSSTPALAAGQT